MYSVTSVSARENNKLVKRTGMGRDCHQFMYYWGRETGAYTGVWEREGRLTYLFFKGIGGLALKRIDKCIVEKKCKTAILLFHTADVYGVPHIFVLKTFMALEHRKLLTTFFKWYFFKTIVSEKKLKIVQPPVHHEYVLLLGINV